MLKITPLSQINPAWRNIKMGTGNQTISQIGCLVICLGMLSGKTPPEVNNELKRINGYDPNSKVIWDKINQTNLGLAFIKRVYSYNNQDVINNLPCLVEVRYKLIRHWVLFIGNRRMIDPLTGREESTNKYPLIGYAIVKKKNEPQPQPPPSPPPPPAPVIALELDQAFKINLERSIYQDVEGLEYYRNEIKNGRTLNSVKAEISFSLEHRDWHEARKKDIKVLNERLSELQTSYTMLIEENKVLRVELEKAKNVRSPLK